MKIESLTIHNILSIANATLTFEDKGLVLVEGWNHDTDRANAAGKTAIFNCLCFVLFDKVPRKITATEILKRDTVDGFAECTILCGTDKFKVIRRRPKGVEFFKNNEPINLTQSDFENIIRLTYDQFLLSMYAVQSNSTNSERFLLKSDSDKKNFLLRLLDLEKFSICKKLADDKLDKLESNIRDLEKQAAANKAKVAAYNESITDISSIESNIHLIKSSVRSVLNEISELEKIPKPDLIKFDTLELDIKYKQDAITKARIRRDILQEQYDNLQQSLTVTVASNCSECGAPLDTPERKQQHKELHKNIIKKLTSMRSLIEEYDVTISSNSSLEVLHKKLSNKKNKENSAYQSAVVRISELRSFIKDKELQIKTLEYKVAQNQELEVKINTISNLIVQLESKIDIQNNETIIYKTLSSIYSPTGAQAYILDSVIDSFNEAITSYINIVWSVASYQINAYKETAKGQITAKFSETLRMGGNDISVGSLSGGEFRALSLCVDFALLEVLYKQFGLRLNPIILDEPFDGLDVVGRTVIINLLTKLSQDRQIIVIDHATEAKSLFPKIIRVEKRNGTSSITIDS